jgi:hypothetical protein
MKRIFKNALGDLLTSALGSLAGLPVLVEGIATKNTAKILEGAGLLLLGLVSNSKEKDEQN